ncbi:hypothetical protein [Winogradskyella alexanderae]|uniref:DUF4468 domain-containing protein n=1 Tax=Winogradskyella alexanderae TaxID=2877123 RepID=A0ABS7XMP0_9FLAO|nr:hypothetical protein [Winogradskyella alexanderae]MCA0131263.1 hypothetical protein [Winogradskyella alexanderae]
MYKIKITHALILFTMLSFSQSRAEHYVLPEFSEGVIIMKNGELSKGIVNYNALTESVILKEGDKYMPLRLDLARNADTLYVDERKFVNRSGKFYELLLDSKSSLYVEYYCVLKSNTQDRSAYGSSSQTSTSISLNQVYNQNIFYQIELPELYTAELKYRYHLVTDKGEYSFETIRDIKKKYSKLKKDYNAYRKVHKVNIKDPKSVRDLIKFLENV